MVLTLGAADPVPLQQIPMRIGIHSHHVWVALISRALAQL